MRVLSVVGNRPQFIKSAPLSARSARGRDRGDRRPHGAALRPRALAGLLRRARARRAGYALDLRTADVDGDAAAARGGDRGRAARTRARLRRHELDARRRARPRARGLPVAHVEAGLRSGDLSMPEEHNRIEVDRIADAALLPGRAQRGDAAPRGRRRPDRGRRRRDGRCAPPVRPRSRASDRRLAASARSGLRRC